MSGISTGPKQQDTSMKALSSRYSNRYSNRYYPEPQLPSTAIRSTASGERKSAKPTSFEPNGTIEPPSNRYSNRYYPEPRSSSNSSQSNTPPRMNPTISKSSQQQDDVCRSSSNRYSNRHITGTKEFQSSSHPMFIGKNSLPVPIISISAQHRPTRPILNLHSTHLSSESKPVSETPHKVSWSTPTSAIVHSQEEIQSSLCGTSGNHAKKQLPLPGACHTASNLNRILKGPISSDQVNQPDTANSSTVHFSSASFASVEMPQLSNISLQESSTRSYDRHSHDLQSPPGIPNFIFPWQSSLKGDPVLPQDQARQIISTCSAKTQPSACDPSPPFLWEKGNVTLNVSLEPHITNQNLEPQTIVFPPHQDTLISVPPQHSKLSSLSIPITIDGSPPPPYIPAESRTRLLRKRRPTVPDFGTLIIPPRKSPEENQETPKKPNTLKKRRPTFTNMSTSTNIEPSTQLPNGPSESGKAKNSFSRISRRLSGASEPIWFPLAQEFDSHPYLSMRALTPPLTTPTTSTTSVPFSPGTPKSSSSYGSLPPSPSSISQSFPTMMGTQHSPVNAATVNVDEQSLSTKTIIPRVGHGENISGVSRPSSKLDISTLKSSPLRRGTSIDDEVVQTLQPASEREGSTTSKRRNSFTDMLRQYIRPGSGAKGPDSETGSENGDTSRWSLGKLVNNYVMPRYGRRASGELSVEGRRSWSLTGRDGDWKRDVAEKSNQRARREMPISPALRRYNDDVTRKMAELP